jgi:hypothetical protein
MDLCEGGIVIRVFKHFKSEEGTIGLVVKPLLADPLVEISRLLMLLLADEKR